MQHVILSHISTFNFDVAFRSVCLPMQVTKVVKFMLEDAYTLYI